MQKALKSNSVYSNINHQKTINFQNEFLKRKDNILEFLLYSIFFETLRMEVYSNYLVEFIPSLALGLPVRQECEQI